MQKVLTYKGYLITTCTKKLAESEKWITELCIAKSYDSGTPAKEYSSADQWDSEREAIDNGVVFGKQIIDGKHPDLELPDDCAPLRGKKRGRMPAIRSRNFYIGTLG